MTLSVDFLPVFLPKLETPFFFSFLLFFAYQCFPGETTSQKVCCNILPTKLSSSYLNVSQDGRQVFDLVCFSMLPWCSRLLSVTVFFKLSLCCWKPFPEKSNRCPTINAHPQSHYIFPTRKSTLIDLNLIFDVHKSVSIDVTLSNPRKRQNEGCLPFPVLNLISFQLQQAGVRE